MRNSRGEEPPSASVETNVGMTCMYVPDTFQRGCVEARPNCHSVRFLPCTPARYAAPDAPHWPLGNTRVAYIPAGPPVA